MRLFYITTDAFGQIGGIAQYNRDFLMATCRHQDCEEVVLMPRLAPNAPGELPVKLTNLANGASSKAKFSQAVIRRIVKESDLDMVICGHINLLPLAYFASKWRGVPLLLMTYGIDVWQPTKSRLINKLATKVDAVVSISQITLDRFQVWTKTHYKLTSILPNAIDLHRFGPGAKDPKLLKRYQLENKTVLLTMGRLVAFERYKGLDEVLELIPELKLEIPNLAYLIIGDGSDRARLQEKAQQLGITDVVTFTGYIPEDEKLAHYHLADAYVMPSRGEGFGFVFLEALAAGIPVVASKVDGGREAVRDGMLGVLVDPDDPADIKRGIHEALRQPLGVVPAGLAYFSFENFEQRVHQLLDAMVRLNGNS